MMRLAEDKKGLCGCTAPFCMAVSCVPAFIRAGGGRHAVVPFCQFVRVGKNGYSGKCGEKGFTYL